MDLTTATHALPPGFPADATLPAVVVELGRRFEAAGHELSLVGGPVRDLFLGRTSPDLDFTTDADPDASEAVGAGWADATWDVGRRFGTIGFRKAGWQLEVTTYRAEQYDPASRKPQVAFGDSLEDDLLRRDFTVNAMALRLPALELVDPFGGMRDLHAGVLRTPGTPEDSFSDDPLRMMRAARFASQLGFAVAPEVEEAMAAMAERITIVSAERVREELVKLVCGAHPRAGLDLLVRTGLADHVLPELPALQLESDEHHRHKDVYAHSLTVLEQAMELEGEYGEHRDPPQPVEGGDPSGAATDPRADLDGGHAVLGRQGMAGHGRGALVGTHSGRSSHPDLDGPKPPAIPTHPTGLGAVSGGIPLPKHRFPPPEAGGGRRSVVAQRLDELVLGHGGAALDVELAGPLRELVLGPVLVGAGLAAALGDLVPAVPGGRVGDPRGLLLARALAAQRLVDLGVLDVGGAGAHGGAVLLGLLLSHAASVVPARRRVEGPPRRLSPAGPPAARPTSAAAPPRPRPARAGPRRGATRAGGCTPGPPPGPGGSPAAP